MVLSSSQSFARPPAMVAVAAVPPLFLPRGRPAAAAAARQTSRWSSAHFHPASLAGSSGSAVVAVHHDHSIATAAVRCCSALGAKLDYPLPQTQTPSHHPPRPHHGLSYLACCCCCYPHRHCFVESWVFHRVGAAV